jgi:hypothetical protein
MTHYGAQRDCIRNREPPDPEKKPKRAKRGEPTERAGKISLYGLSIEDALRAAAKTGRPPPTSESERPKRQRKKRTKPS